MDANKVGATIVVLRKRAGMTQRELAEQLRVTDKAVSRWERGQGVPDPSLLAALADVLNTDIEVILEGELAFGEPSWRGVLVLRYGEGMGPDTLLFGKRFIYLQVGYLMLAGVRRIAVVGGSDELASARRALTWLSDHDVSISFFDTTDDKGRFDSLGQLPTEGSGDSATRGSMLVNGLDFLYGKDLTRAFKRQMADCPAPVRLVGHCGTPTGIFFVPGEREPLDLLRGFDESAARPVALERGMTCFPIETAADVLDASTMISILECRGGEPVMDLEGIARHRGM